MEEYIVINKTKLQGRIDYLENRLLNGGGLSDVLKLVYLNEITVLENLLLQSKDLKPILENAYFEGECWG